MIFKVINWNEEQLEELNYAKIKNIITHDELYIEIDTLEDLLSLYDIFTEDITISHYPTYNGGGLSIKIGDQ